MKILYTGTDKRCREFDMFFSSGTVQITRFNFNEIDSLSPKNFDALFDLEFDDYPDRFIKYIQYRNLPLILCTVKTSLKQLLMHHPLANQVLLYGLNALPGFIQRPLWEMTSGSTESTDYFPVLCRNLGITAELVADRTGMVTPRIICMIINEAYYTLQDGTASRDDIDTAMKLGTNYPKGPFEWIRTIGLRNVYEVLNQVYQNTKDERYRIAPLLRDEYFEIMSLKNSINL